MFSKGAFAVEFFFILSGYLMMNSVAKKNAEYPNPKKLGTETVGFLTKKIKGIYVENAVSYVIAVVFMCCTATAGIKGILRLIIYSVPGDLFLLKMTGISGDYFLNIPVWYISSMLIVMAIMYPMLRKWEDMSRKVIIPLASLLIFGYLISTDGDVFTVTKWVGFTFKGNLRAFSEIGLGVVCWQIVQKMKKRKFGKLERFVLTAAKWICYLLVIAWMCLGIGSFDTACLLMLAAAITITFSEAGIDSALYNNKLCLWLGKFSMPLYFSHYFYTSSLSEFANLNNVLPAGMSDNAKFGIYLLCSFTTALFVMSVSKLIRNLINKKSPNKKTV